MTEDDTAAYVTWHEPALERAADHGCLDEDVDTGSPLVCGQCLPPAPRPMDVQS